MTRRYVARDVHYFVTDVIAAGRPNWPVSRTILNGLTLRQVSDAIKMYIAEIYISHLEDPARRQMYVTLRDNWQVLYQELPSTFVRDDVWQEARELDPNKRTIELTVSAVDWVLNPETRNREEIEFYDAEEYCWFISYLESLPTDRADILDDVLGHLSCGGVHYTDNTLSVMNAA